tara:strand:- start:434 stop:883 length:450 start_codon:yes stop_codon:yes gene_type:complete
MSLKPRHISDNKKQILNQLNREILAPRVLPKMRYERHGALLSKVDPSKIIGKTSTDQFPIDAITIRVTSAKNKRFTAYFRGKEKVHQWTDYKGFKRKSVYPDGILKIAVDCSANITRYSFTGDMSCDSFTPEDKVFALRYVEDILYGQD